MSLYHISVCVPTIISTILTVPSAYKVVWLHAQLLIKYRRSRTIGHIVSPDTVDCHHYILEWWLYHCFVAVHNCVKDLWRMQHCHLHFFTHFSTSTASTCMRFTLLTPPPPLQECHSDRQKRIVSFSSLQSCLIQPFPVIVWLKLSHIQTWCHITLLQTRLLIESCVGMNKWINWSVSPLSLQSCTLYAIFTDATGRIAWKHYWSPKDVIRRAARLAVSNIRRFGRPIPTFSQLK